MKEVTRTFFDKDDESINFLKFQIKRANIKKFNELSPEQKAHAIDWYDTCIKTLQIMKNEVEKQIKAS